MYSSILVWLPWWQKWLPDYDTCMASTMVVPVVKQWRFTLNREVVTKATHLLLVQGRDGSRGVLAIGGRGAW